CCIIIYGEFTSLLSDQCSVKIQKKSFNNLFHLYDGMKPNIDSWLGSITLKNQELNVKESAISVPEK
ncbi:hypothetical protein CN514_25055, partial [Bacillus sp. AFS001701]|uniref:hypothetical protein n=1 Tax=Bacillus sp. AFS001701 TaxID=2033480 RepID=UPI000BFB03CC